MVYEDGDMPGKIRTKWLERMGKAIGFDPSNVKYIVAKSLDLIKAGIDLEGYKEGD